MADPTSAQPAQEAQIVLNTDSGGSIEAPASLVLIAILSVLTPQQQSQIFNRVVNTLARGRTPIISSVSAGGANGNGGAVDG